MLKKEARKTYKNKRAELSEPERSKLDDLMLIQFQTVDLPFIQSLLSYWPIEENNEPNTHLFTEFLKFRNPEMKVCYPVSDFNNMIMEAVATDIDTPFEKANLNIHEPVGGLRVPVTEIEMVFVPLLAFDKNGYRVGYGKGFYDIYLAQCADDCIKVGFCYFEPLDSIDDSNEFDVPLDLCITPQNVYVF
ncbi:MAG TPA: 5-formyltetrahydrofolate cyclo-ligase [Chitinophagaceae bacterium]|nr:5-formyltetrahydrofolate cyclo-ligase [Chitinophagaceae bacterium]